MTSIASKIHILYAAFMITALLACGQQPGKVRKEKGHPAPALPYNLEAPVVYEVPEGLEEISGISFRNGDPTTIWAEQDEEGHVFRFQLGKPGADEMKFGKKGDYEDIQVAAGEVFMLRSDGVIYRFPIPEEGEISKDRVTEYKHLLPSGEYEGLFFGPAADQLLVLCKHCDENTKKTTTVYRFTIQGTNLQPAGQITIDVTGIASLAGVKKLPFEPSALAWNSRTSQWFILSSVNKMLVVAGKDWTPLAVYALDPALYNQPEGMAFDRWGNLFISNEKGTHDHATLLRIPLRNNP